MRHSSFVLLFLFRFITKNLRLTSFDDLQDWDKLKRQIDHHTHSVQELDKLTKNSIVKVHKHNFLEPAAIGYDTQNSHDGLSDAQPQNALVKISDEKVLVLRVSVQLRYERCPLKTDLNLAEAIHKVREYRQQKVDIFSLVVSKNCNFEVSFHLLG